MSIAGEVMHVGEVETPDCTQETSDEHYPLCSQEVVQPPPYQTPDEYPANNVAKDGYPGVVTALAVAPPIIAAVSGWWSVPLGILGT